MNEPHRFVNCLKRVCLLRSHPGGHCNECGEAPDHSNHVPDAVMPDEAAA